MNVWDFKSTLELLTLLKPIATENGLGIGICGSVLFTGISNNDLDIIVFPLQTRKDYSYEKFLARLADIGFLKVRDRTRFHVEDTKRVVFSRIGGKRVDFFLLA